MTNFIKLLYASSFSLSLTTMMTSCGWSPKEDNLPAEYFLLGIENYSGNKLALCSGNPNPKTIPPAYLGINYHWYARDNRSWYTVDREPLMRPNYVGDLLATDTYDYLAQKKFQIVLDEFCNNEVSIEAANHASRLLEPGGVFISKYPCSDLSLLKDKLLLNGMAEVIAGSVSKILYEIKNKPSDQIIKIFKDKKYKNPLTSGMCSYVAIKK